MKAIILQGLCVAFGVTAVIVIRYLFDNADPNMTANNIFYATGGVFAMMVNNLLEHRKRKSVVNARVDKPGRKKTKRRQQ